MKNVKRIRVLFGLAVSSLIASGTAVADGWSGDLLIKEINDQPSSGVGAGFVFVETTTPTNAGGCSYGSGFYFAVTDDRRKRLFATLLSAHLAGKTVRMFFSTNSSNCHYWGYPLMDGVVIK